MQTTVWTVLLIVNASWFGMGAFHFSLKPEASARSLVPRDQRASPLFRTLSDSIRFLGGLNFGFMVLCVMLLVFGGLFSDARLEGPMLFIFATDGTLMLANARWVAGLRRDKPLTKLDKPPFRYSA